MSGRPSDRYDAHSLKDAATSTIRDAGEKAKERADESIDRAAEGMHSAADTLRGRAEHFSGIRAEANERAADTFERTASYLEQHDSEQMLQGVKSYVRAHPMIALGGAIIGGLLFWKYFL
jgi:hypothetical protein